MIFTFNPKGGGGSTKVYATLDIKTTEAELAGKDITITFEDETYTVQGTKMGTVLDSFGYYHAKDQIKVQSLGDYTIKCGEAEDTFTVDSFTTNDIELSLIDADAIYWYGKINNKLIGSVSADGYSYIESQGNSYTLTLADFNDDNFSANIPSSGRNLIGLFASNTIDLTNYSGMEIEAMGTGYIRTNITSDKQITDYSPTITKYAKLSTTKTKYTLDISSATGEKYVFVGNYTPSSNFKVYSVKLVK